MTRDSMAASTVISLHDVLTDFTSRVRSSASPPWPFPTPPPSAAPCSQCLGRLPGPTDHAVRRSRGPQTDRSAMDGFAWPRRGRRWPPARRTTAVVGECLAGHPFDWRGRGRAGVRIMTGAVVPPTALMRWCRSRTPAATRAARSTVNVATCRRREHPAAGFGGRAGAIAAHRRGTRIRAAEVGVLAVLGRGPRSRSAAGRGRRDPVHRRRGGGDRPRAAAAPGARQQQPTPWRRRWRRAALRRGGSGSDRTRNRSCRRSWSRRLPTLTWC